MDIWIYQLSLKVVCGTQCGPKTRQPSFQSTTKTRGDSGDILVTPFVL